MGDDPATFSEPEYNEQYEIGIKSDWLDERLITTLSFFQNEHNNIRYKPDPQNEPFLWAVRGKERSRGVDFTILGKIYDAWYLRGSLGVMEAKIINDKQNPELVGQRLRNTSEVQGNLFLRYAPNQTWFAEAGITHVGKRYNYSHSSRTKTVTPENLDAFTRIDLMGGYKFSDNLSTTLSIYNLTDEKYWRSNSMPGNGRSFLVKFNYEF